MVVSIDEICFQSQGGLTQFGAWTCGMHFATPQWPPSSFAQMPPRAASHPTVLTASIRHPWWVLLICSCTLSSCLKQWIPSRAVRWPLSSRSKVGTNWDSLATDGSLSKDLYITKLINVFKALKECGFILEWDCCSLPTRVACLLFWLRFVFPLPTHWSHVAWVQVGRCLFGALPSFWKGTESHFSAVLLLPLWTYKVFFFYYNWQRIYSC